MISPSPSLWLALLIALTPLPSFAYEFSLNAGLQVHNANFDSEDEAFNNQDDSDAGFHLGFSIKNQLGKSQRHYIGAGLDFDTFLGDTVLGYRAIDYQYQLSKKFRVGGFFGAASLDNGLPQNGFYLGLNTNYFFSEKLSLGFEIRHGNGLGRDILLDDDPQQGVRPDFFTDFVMSGVQVHWHF